MIVSKKAKQPVEFAGMTVEPVASIDQFQIASSGSHGRYLPIFDKAATLGDGEVIPLTPGADDTQKALAIRLGMALRRYANRESDGKRIGIRRTKDGRVLLVRVPVAKKRGK